MKDNLPTVPTKFCKNCHWFKQHFMGHPQCINPMNVTLDPIYGNVRYIKRITDIRQDIHKCGIDGKWYEVKQ